MFKYLRLNSPKKIKKVYLNSILTRVTHTGSPEDSYIRSQFEGNLEKLFH